MLSDDQMRRSRCSLRKARWRLLWPLFVAGRFGLGAVAAQAQQFSADIVTRHDDVSTPAGRLSVRDGKVRIETAEHAGRLLPGRHNKTVGLFRAARRALYHGRRTVEPVDPAARSCRSGCAVPAMAGDGAARGCDRGGRVALRAYGEETIDGHSAVVFRASSGNGEVFFGWIDRERQFPLQIRTEDGVLFKLEQIKDEPQPASSFELPASYRKFSPGSADRADQAKRCMGCKARRDRGFTAAKMIARCVGRNNRASKSGYAVLRIGAAGTRT